MLILQMCSSVPNLSQEQDRFRPGTKDLKLNSCVVAVAKMDTGCHVNHDIQITLRK